MATCWCRSWSMASRHSFVLDTGAERSMVSPQAVQRLHLALDKWVGTRMHGIGGIIEHPNADPRSLTLGGVPLHRHDDHARHQPDRRPDAAGRNRRRSPSTGCSAATSCRCSTWS